jgi:hypothetical protein
VAVQSGTYTGTTSQVLKGIHGKVRLVVVPGKVKVFSYHFHARCQAHKSGYNNTFISSRITIRNGHFKRSANLSFTGPEGLRATASLGLLGRFPSPGKARGAFDVILTFKNASGAVVDNCDTGGVNWRAST